MSVARHLPRRFGFSVQGSVLLKERQCEAAKRRGKLGSGIFANPAGALMEGYAEDPVKAVLDLPGATDIVGDPSHLGWQAHDQQHRRLLALAIEFPSAVHHPDGRQPRPAPERGHPTRSCEHIVLSSFPASVTVFPGHQSPQARHLIVLRPIPQKQLEDSRLQGRLVGLDDQPLVRRPFQDRPRRFPLTVHGIPGDDGSREFQQF